MEGFLNGKNIAITGAGSGIGKAIALAVATEGANIVVADYGVALDGSDPTSDIANATVEEIKSLGVDAIAVTGDVSQMQTGQDVVAASINSWGSIDGVVCVAGILRERMLFNDCSSPQGTLHNLPSCDGCNAKTRERWKYSWHNFWCLYSFNRTTKLFSS